MKKLLIIVIIACMLSACKNSKTDLQTNKVMPTDTSALYNNNSSSTVGQKAKEVSKSQTSASNQGKSSTSASDKTVSSTSQTSTTKKKGWSNRAKDAVIGGAAGAVGGAIISKHKGKGAVIGGAVGAAGGYIIGNEKDKKNKR